MEYLSGSASNGSFLAEGCSVFHKQREVRCKGLVSDRTVQTAICAVEFRAETPRRCSIHDRST